jgi:hypothetical protein
MVVRSKQELGTPEVGQTVVIFENVVSDNEIQIKLNIVRNYLYYSVRDLFWLLSRGHLFHISVFNLSFILEMDVENTPTKEK